MEELRWGVMGVCRIGVEYIQPVFGGICCVTLRLSKGQHGISRWMLGEFYDFS